MRDTAYEIVMIRSGATSRSACATSRSNLADVGARIPMTFGSCVTIKKDAISEGRNRRTSEPSNTVTFVDKNMTRGAVVGPLGSI